MTNVPLCATPGSLFLWSFDRVVAGSVYSPATVQPVLHRYNDAKYIWDDAAVQKWLRAFVCAHGGVAVLGRAMDGLDQTSRVVVHLDG